VRERERERERESWRTHGALSRGCYTSASHVYLCLVAEVKSTGFDLVPPVSPSPRNSLPPVAPPARRPPLISHLLASEGLRNTYSSPATPGPGRLPHHRTSTSQAPALLLSNFQMLDSSSLRVCAQSRSYRFFWAFTRSRQILRAFRCLRRRTSASARIILPLLTYQRLSTLIESNGGEGRTATKEEEKCVFPSKAYYATRSRKFTHSFAFFFLFLSFFHFFLSLFPSSIFSFGFFCFSSSFFLLFFNGIVNILSLCTRSCSIPL
jgi:hypothetical protein